MSVLVADDVGRGVKSGVVPDAVEDVEGGAEGAGVGVGRVGAGRDFGKGGWFESGFVVGVGVVVFGLGFLGEKTPGFGVVH